MKHQEQVLWGDGYFWNAVDICNIMSQFMQFKCNKTSSSAHQSDTQTIHTIVGYEKGLMASSISLPKSGARHQEICIVGSPSPLLNPNSHTHEFINTELRLVVKA
jgi:hypothetical protein